MFFIDGAQELPVAIRNVFRGSTCKIILDWYHLEVRRIGACLDSFQRKEGLRAKTPKTVAYLAGKPKEDSSMRQRQTCPKAFTARSACLARHGEARLPNLAYQRR